ncbi:MAG: ABC transporter substrate-binding protein [Chloroflexi bacterium]|nr:ABC transporter substrate-binding protein [Chloroflexota bacterium]
MSALLSRRQALAALASTAGAALLAACGGQSAPASSAPAPPASSKPSAAVSAASSGPANAAVSAAPASSAAGASAATSPAASGATPRPGGTLRMGVLGDPRALDPHVTGIFGDVITPMFDRLIVYDDKLNPQPSLAESWDASTDLKQIKLSLRKGVQFHTGKEMTADDVKWNYTRIKTDPAVAVTGLPAQAAQITSIDTPDPYTLVIKSDTPYPGVWDFLALALIQDPVTAQGPDAKTKIVGTGPFKFVEWVQGDHISIAKHASYWRSGTPYLDGVKMQIFKDPQAMISALEAGTLDVADAPSLTDVDRLKKDSKWQVVLNQLSGSRVIIALNTTQPPLDSKDFRQALNYSMDRKRIADSVYLSTGQPVDLPFAPTSPAYDATDDQFYTFDLDKAKALVASSGAKSPSIDFTYASTSAQSAQLAQIWQGDLAKIGVTLNLKSADPVQTSLLLSQAKYNGMTIASTLFGQLHITMEDGNPFYSAHGINWSNFKSDDLTKLWTSIDTEPDVNKQKALAAQFRKMVLDQSWNIVVCSAPPAFIASNKVHGLRYALEERLVPTEAWLEA